MTLSGEERKRKNDSKAQSQGKESAARQNKCIECLENEKKKKKKENTGLHAK